MIETVSSWLIFIIEGTEYIISSNLTFQKWHARFTTVAFRYNSENFYNICLEITCPAPLRPAGELLCVF